MVQAVAKSASPVQFTPQVGPKPFTPIATVVDSRDDSAVISKPDFAQDLLVSGVSKRDLTRLVALANRYEEANLQANRSYDLDALAEVAHGLLTEFHAIKFEGNDKLALYTALTKLLSRNLINDLQANDFTQIAAKLFAFDRQPDPNLDPRIATIAQENLGGSLTLGKEALYTNTAKAYLAIWDLVQAQNPAEQRQTIRLAERALLQAVTSQIPAHLAA